jgi:hypothetical protein
MDQTHQHCGRLYILWYFFIHQTLSKFLQPLQGYAEIKSADFTYTWKFLKLLNRLPDGAWKFHLRSNIITPSYPYQTEKKRLYLRKRLIFHYDGSNEN